MDVETAYKAYVALKSHFGNTSYDYFKYGIAGTKANADSYNNRNDRVLFKRACKLYSEDEYINLLIANFICDQESWIGDILDDVGRRRLFEWKKVIQSIKYTFKQDLIFIEDYLADSGMSFNELFKRGSPYPPIVKFCIEKSISLETFAIMNKILNFVPRVDRLIQERILWDKCMIISIRYVDFIVKDDVSVYKKMLAEKFYRKELTNGEIKDTI
ncbi:MAG: hypothetical protein ACO3UU_15165 [Minisyncoccia bacterium]